jgi:adenylosuccinate synthase
MRIVIAVSGPIAVGKSVFIAELVQSYGAIRISTRELIQALRDVPSERGPLQEAGEALDRETEGQWVAQALSARIDSLNETAVVIIDSVRIPKQVEHLRTAFPDKVWHVHLTASPEVLAARFDQRKKKGDPAVLEFATYQEARANPTEAGVDRLGDIADIRLNTDNLDPGSIAKLAAERFAEPTP